MEGKRRTDDEAKERKKDNKKHKLNQMRNLPAAIMQINKLNDPEQICKHTQLNLPAPQLSDRELEEIAKLGTDTDITALLEDGKEEDENKPTHALVSSLRGVGEGLGGGSGVVGRNLLLKTPTRTPARGDTVLLEAQNLLALTHSSTPLLGGENTPLHPSDFSGATPSHKDVQTANALATPLRRGATPLVNLNKTPTRNVGGNTPYRTPVRDALHINPSSESSSPSSMALVPVEDLNYEKRKKSETTRQLQAAFSALPTPKNKYTIASVTQTFDDNLENEEPELEEDASDFLLRKQQEEAERVQAELKLRSQVLQRNLPRPLIVNKSILKPITPDLSELETAGELVKGELLNLISEEGVSHPVLHKRFKPPVVDESSQSESLTLKDLEEAASLLEEEVQTLKVEKPLPQLHSSNSSPPPFLFVPSLKAFVSFDSLSPQQHLESLEYSFQKVKKRIARENTRAKKLEQRISLVFGGYQQKAMSLYSELENVWEELRQAELEYNSLTKLKKKEEEAIILRTNRLQEEVLQQREREAALQLRYGNLRTSSDQLHRQIALRAAQS